MSFDYERAAQLLDIVEKVAKVSPQYMAISAEAMAELKTMNEELVATARANKAPSAQPLVPEDEVESSEPVNPPEPIGDNHVRRV